MGLSKNAIAMIVLGSLGATAIVVGSTLVGYKTGRRRKRDAEQSSDGGSMGTGVASRQHSRTRSGFSDATVFSTHEQHSHLRDKSTGSTLNATPVLPAQTRQTQRKGRQSSRPKKEFLNSTAAETTTTTAFSTRGQHSRGKGRQYSRGVQNTSTLQKCSYPTDSLENLDVSQRTVFGIKVSDFKEGLDDIVKFRPSSIGYDDWKFLQESSAYGTHKKNLDRIRLAHNRFVDTIKATPFNKSAFKDALIAYAKELDGKLPYGHSKYMAWAALVMENKIMGEKDIPFYNRLFAKILSYKDCR